MFQLRLIGSLVVGRGSGHGITATTGVNRATFLQKFVDASFCSSFLNVFQAPICNLG